MSIRFRIRPFPLLAALAFVAAAISIGEIQRGRAGQKQHAFDKIESLRILLQTDMASDGLVRNWQPEESGALKHRGFAFVWYLAAFAAVVAAIVSSVERRKHEA
ncbi:MAG: hypothetical protein KGZ31_04250 [Sulfuritalea sp.]|nr:hypothetical protein [Sulfuritalea sp.]